MIAARQIAFGGGKRKPYDAEIEYLESTGTQWIDTGIVANGEFDADYTISIPSSFRKFIVGGAKSTTQHLNFGQYEPNGNFIMAYLDTYWEALTTIAANTTYTARIHYASGSQTATVNGTAASSRSLSGTESLNLNIYLFKRNFYRAGDTLLPMMGKMYSFKIWQNGVLVRDFIPVRKGNIGYMYDRVSGQLFGNAGTGAFIVGPDVIDYTAKDYVQDGLVAMWDGIENAGWGVHDESFGGSINLVSMVDKLVGTSTAENIIKVTKNFTMTLPDEFSMATIQFCRPTTEPFGSAFLFYKGSANASGERFGLLGTSNSYGNFGIRYWNGEACSSGYRIAKSGASCVVYTVGDGRSRIRRLDTSENYVLSSVDVAADLFNIFYSASGSVFYHNIRLYNRVLTDEEIAHNYEIDKARFDI
jgi:hypothetical protein